MVEVFAHTADAGLRVRSPDLNSLFAEAGQGLYALIVTNISAVELRSSVEFRIEGRDLAYLLADWLNELLFVFESKRILLREFDVTVGSNGLDAVARGETVDERRHVLDHEIKAVTYHGLKVEQVDDGWLAEVIVDI